MEVRVELITPEMAQKYLEWNRVNRNISQSTVNKYASDMENGMWQMNGEAIKFYQSGKLADGQHRLMAIVKSGVPCRMLVIRGIPENSTIFDLGRNRSILDSIIIEANGEEDKDVINQANVAVARLHWYVQTGKNTVSNYDVRTFFDRHNLTLKVMAPIRKKGHDNGITIKSTVFQLPIMYALESGENYDKLVEFANVLCGDPPKDMTQSAAHVLRNDVMCKRINVQGGAADRKRACICVENAINDFCRGRERKKTYKNSTTQVYSNNQIFSEKLHV